MINLLYMFQTLHKENKQRQPKLLLAEHCHSVAPAIRRRHEAENRTDTMEHRKQERKTHINLCGPCALSHAYVCKNMVIKTGCCVFQQNRMEWLMIQPGVTGPDLNRASCLETRSPRGVYAVVVVGRRGARWGEGVVHGGGQGWASAAPLH